MHPRALTGPSGPTENALLMSTIPIVLTMLPTVPIAKSFQDKLMGS